VALAELLRSSRETDAAAAASRRAAGGLLPGPGSTSALNRSPIAAVVALCALDRARRPLCAGRTTVIATNRRLGRLPARCLLAAVALAAGHVTPALASPIATGASTTSQGLTRAPANVKYYVVIAADLPGGLAAIAGRLLDAPGRAAEILELNVGRAQADGGALTPDGVLKAGWVLQLPWDAVGAGVRHGQLPMGPTGTSSPAPPTMPAAPGPPVGCEIAPAVADLPGPTASVDADAGSAGADWAQHAVGAAAAWSTSRGAGVLVAVIDSGVDRRAPQFGDRVRAGADMVTGVAEGGPDCLGAGTVMAAIIAAGPGSDAAATGIAPEALVLPVRLFAGPGNPARPDLAMAIEVAVGMGAQVIALGTPPDRADPVLEQVIAAAIAHGVVVVAPAPVVTEDVATQAAARLQPGLLTVAGLDERGQPIARYDPMAVDVAGPGAAIASLGIGGRAVTVTGPQYAVAFVAGAVALVRSAHPELAPEQVAARIVATARSVDGGAGWEMADPGSAVSKTSPPPEQEAASTGSVVLWALPLLVLVIAAVTGWLGWRRRSRRRRPSTIRKSIESGGRV
jgi:membrane-anchored mycosin MYCP